MSITALQGPVVAYGSAIVPGTTNYAPDYNPEQGPSMFWGGAGILDPRPTLTYNPGQNFGNPTAGWLGFTKINTLNVIPMTKSNTIIAGAAHTVKGTAMSLASTSVDGLAVGVNGALFGSVTGASLVT